MVWKLLPKLPALLNAQDANGLVVQQRLHFFGPGFDKDFSVLVVELVELDLTW